MKAMRIILELITSFMIFAIIWTLFALFSEIIDAKNPTCMMLGIFVSFLWDIIWSPLKHHSRKHSITPLLDLFRRFKIYKKGLHRES